MTYAPDERRARRAPHPVEYRPEFISGVGMWCRSPALMRTVLKIIAGGIPTSMTGLHFRLSNGHTVIVRRKA